MRAFDVGGCDVVRVVASGEGECDFFFLELVRYIMFLGLRCGMILYG